MAEQHRKHGYTGAPLLSGRRLTRWFGGMGAAAALALGALAGSAGSASADTTIEAESMRLRAGKVTRERGVSGGRADTLSATGSASKRLTTGAVSQLVVYVRRGPCPARLRPVRIRVTVDGRRALVRTVAATNYVRYSARLSLPAGTHTVRVGLSTGRRARACDRRLRLDRLVLVEAPGTGVSGGPAGGRPVATPVTTAATGAPSSSVRGPLLFLGDFETGNLSQWSSFQSQSPDRIQVLQSRVRRGRYAARFFVREGDMAAAGERSEVLWGGSSNLTLREGQEHYIGWSTYFASAEYPIVTTGHQMVMQAHPKGNLPPPVKISSDAGELSLELTNGAAVKGDGTTPWRTPLTRDVWHDFVLHAKWSASQQTGFVELWHNGVKVLSRYSVATLDAPGVDSYLKFGYYRSGKAVSPDGAVYHDEVRVGTSYEDVDPAG